MSNMEKTTNEVPKRKAGSEPESLIKERTGEKSPGLPRDTDFDDEIADPRKRDRMNHEYCAVSWRSEFYNSLEQYSINMAFRYLSASKKIASPFFADLKRDFLDFLDECERRGLERLSEVQRTLLDRLRADVVAEKFEAPTFLVAKLDRFGSAVGKEEGRRQMENLESALSETKKEIFLNAFWHSLRRAEISDFITAFYHLAQAKERRMAEYIGMKREFLHALDEALAMPADEQAQKLREDIRRMRGVVQRW